MSDAKRKVGSSNSAEIIEEETLAEAFIKSWRNFKQGTLKVWPTSVSFYAKSSFWKPSSLQAEFKNETINSFRVEGSPDKVLIFNIISEEGETNEALIFKDDASIQEITTALRKTLGPLDEKSIQERKREEEELQRQEAERRRKQLVESYLQYVWSSAGAIHLVTKSIYIIIAALSKEDWDTAKDQFAALWRETDLLQAHHGFDMASALQGLRSAFEAGNGPDTTNSCAAYIERLFDQCLTQKLTDGGWDEPLMGRTLRPSRFQLTYWLLFQALYREAILDCGIEDWLLVDQSISKMRVLSPVLIDSFGVSTADCVAKLAEASSKRDYSQLLQCAIDFESRLTASSSSHWSREVK
jgi:hypothetical protein